MPPAVSRPVRGSRPARRGSCPGLRRAMPIALRQAPRRELHRSDIRRCRHHLLAAIVAGLIVIDRPRGVPAEPGCFIVDPRLVARDAKELLRAGRLRFVKQDVGAVLLVRYYFLQCLSILRVIVPVCDVTREILLVSVHDSRLVHTKRRPSASAPANVPSVDAGRPVSFLESAVLIRLIAIIFKVVRQFQLYQAHLRVYLVVHLQKVVILTSAFSELILTMGVDPPRDHFQILIITARL